MNLFPQRFSLFNNHFLVKFASLHYGRPVRLRRIPELLLRSSLIKHKQNQQLKYPLKFFTSLKEADRIKKKIAKTHREKIEVTVCSTLPYQIFSEYRILTNILRAYQSIMIFLGYVFPCRCRCIVILIFLGRSGLTSGGGRILFFLYLYNLDSCESFFNAPLSLLITLAPDYFQSV